jgi:hypothetical protein
MLGIGTLPAGASSGTRLDDMVGLMGGLDDDGIMCSEDGRLSLGDRSTHSTKELFLHVR